MTDDLILTHGIDSLALAGNVANQAAARYVFADYQSRKADNTNRRQAADLALFAEFLRTAGLTPGDLRSDPEAWRGVSWGIVEAFSRWQLKQGYAVGSVNVHLATVKGYAALALKAGAISTGDYALIMTVKGYSRKETKRIDEKRDAAGIDTRKGTKKADWVALSTDQAAQLLERPNTPQGRRDALLLALMIDHGLRVGEVAILTVTDFNLKAGELCFYRPKVDKTQIHKLTARTLKAARAYFKLDAPAIGQVWRTSASRSATGNLAGQGMSERAITKRVAFLGESVGAPGLSAHDLRHFWATRAARNNTQIDRLQDAGGWNSPAMPLRYIEAAKIANEGVKLD